jgi:hypothetical protein
MKVLIWHVHGSYLTSLLQGEHTYLLPTLPDRGPQGAGRARTWEWPASALEIGPEACADAEIDVVVLQRGEELNGWAQQWMGGREPGRDIPAIYLEHNAPQGRINDLRHVAADRDDLVVVHVTHFNALFWDTGSTPTRVIEHGIVDPGHRYSGELERAAVAINEPVRRARVTGTDLLERIADVAPVDLFGMHVTALHDPPRVVAHEDLPQAVMHTEMARRRAYVHPIRWTSLGLSLLEAMHLGMPVLALATTEAIQAVPAAAGAVSTNVAELGDALARLLRDPEMARACGDKARAVALERYGLDRFLRDWDELLEEVAA